MVLNNPALYDSVIIGLASCGQAWLTDNNSSNYLNTLTNAQQIAIEIDSKIPTIIAGPSTGQCSLLSSIVKSVFANRTPSNLLANSYSDIANSITALFIEFSSSLQINESEGVPYPSSITVIAANSGDHVLALIPINVNTDNQITVQWHCYDGTTTSRIMGTTSVNVVRGTGAPTIISNSPANNFIDTTANTGYAWNPTVNLGGNNNIQVVLSADPNNQINLSVIAFVNSTSTSNAAPPVDPIAIARADLLATNPEIALFSDIGRTPPSSNPGTVVTALTDYSGNNHNAIVSGNVTYTPLPSGKPGLKYPASGGRIAPAGAITVSQNHIFAFRYTLGDAVGAAGEAILASGTSPASTFITINWAANGNIYYGNTNGAAVVLGTALAGTHDYAIVIDNLANTATLYIDSVAGAPVAIANNKNAWTVPVIGGVYADANTNPLINGYFQAFAEWYDISQAVNKIVKFNTFTTAAYGNHS